MHHLAKERFLGLDDATTVSDQFLEKKQTHFHVALLDKFSSQNLTKISLLTFNI
jgi:hypothetical protein